jgi:amidase
LVPGALGSDGLGSVRIPAAWTHLVGIKPQRGRISTWPYSDPFNGLTCIGPLARTVLDAALMLDVATGNHPEDRDQPPPPAEPFQRVAERADPGRRLRIALAPKAPFSIFPTRLDPENRTALERLAGVLGQLGHEVEEANPSYGVLGAGVIPRSVDGLAWWLRELPDSSALDRRTREAAAAGRFLSRLLRPGRALEMPMRWQVGAIFRRFDVVLAPTTARPPMPVGTIDGLSGLATDRTMIQYCPYTWPWNATGWPAVNVPAGLTEAGLPIGVQLIGPESREAELIALAAQLEAVERWHEHRPPHAPEPADS